MIKSQTRKYEILTGLVILGLSFGSLLLAESGLRISQFIKFGQAKSVETSKNFYIEEGTGLRLNYPNRKVGKVRINNLGFRGPDIPIDKPKNTIRLAFLGSSSTYDPYVEEGRNWPHLVAEKLGKYLSNCRVDFVNAGQPGYSPRRIADLYEHHVKQTNPDILFVLASDVNRRLDDMANREGFGVGHREYRSFLSDYSILFEKIEKNVRIVQLQRAAKTRVGKLEPDYDRLGKEFRAALLNLVGQIKSNGDVPVLITVTNKLRQGQTLEEQIDAGATQLFYMSYMYLPDLISVREYYNSVIHEVGEETGVAVIDDEHIIPADAKHFVDSNHFAAAGSMVMADRVLEQLITSDWGQELLKKNGCSIIEGVPEI